MDSMAFNVVLLLLWTWGISRLLLCVLPTTATVKEFIICAHLGSVVIVLLIFGVFSASNDAQTAISFLLIAFPLLCLARFFGYCQDAGLQSAAEQEVLRIAIQLRQSDGTNSDQSELSRKSES